MSDHLLARFRQHTLERAAARNVQRALRDSIVEIVILPGDPVGKRALRGIPCIADGVAGTQPGTNPEQALMDATCDCGRTKDPDRRWCNQCHQATLNASEPA